MDENDHAKPPEAYEKYTFSEKGSTCPIAAEECVKDPQQCRFYQPFLINEVHPLLHTATQKDVYMCVFDCMRISLNNVLLLLSGQMVIGNPGMPPGGRGN